MANVSKYFEQLPPEAKRQYQDKTGVISGIDPFTLSCNQHGQSNNAQAQLGSLPPIDSTDLLSYLVLQITVIMITTSKAVQGTQVLRSIQPIHQWLDKGDQSLGHQ